MPKSKLDFTSGIIQISLSPRMEQEHVAGLDEKHSGMLQLFQLLLVKAVLQVDQLVQLDPEVEQLQEQLTVPLDQPLSLVQV